MGLIFEKFFHGLGLRNSNENGLSDVTYALCISSKMFSKFFLGFIFPGKSFDGDGNWEREIVAEKEKCRIDFLYQEKGLSFVIENKINDFNTHNDEYYLAFPDSAYTRGFISNYTPEPAMVSHYYEGKGRTWKSFIKSVSSSLLPILNDEEKIIIEYYIKYVKEIIAYREIKVMNFSNLDSIYSFFSISEEYALSRGMVHWKVNDPLSWSKYSFLGSWFVDKKSNSYFYCIDLQHGTPMIELCILFSGNKDKSWYDYLRKQIITMDLKNIDEKIVYDKDFGLCFSLKCDLFLRFFNGLTSDVEEQKRCLYSFYDEIHEIVDLYKETT